MLKRVLFVDRDGTVLREPADEQIDSLAKLQFLPYVITSLSRLRELGYSLVMVTNQDGLGTASFPEENFWPPHELMLSILASEGVYFEEIFIDRTHEHEQSPTRKPGTAMLENYLALNDIDFERSFTVGDRQNDVLLAQNLGCKAILVKAPNAPIYADKTINAAPEPDHTVLGWNEIVRILTTPPRKASLERSTAETHVTLHLNLDGNGIHDIDTGLKFYDHMLDQLSRHSGIDINLKVRGDLEVDEHHTIEDSAIALGAAVKIALGDKRGLERYGFLLPMDEALVSCAIDFSGRAWCVFEGSFDREYVGDFPTEMLSHWLHSFAEHAGLNLHLKILEGSNTHHKVEASFKALARCLKDALRVTGDRLPSTKEVI